jgi:hypothetical protein
MAIINVTYDRTHWIEQLGNDTAATERMDQFITECNILNEERISDTLDVQIGLTDSATGSREMTIAPPFDPNFDFNTVVSSEWGVKFLRLFEKLGLIVEI